MNSVGAVGLIPARSGSKRIQDKNILQLNGHPLMAYTIRAAIESRIFERVIVSSESAFYRAIALHYGAEVIERQEKFATDTSPDIEWVREALEFLETTDKVYDIFSILRPTSPLRTAQTIRNAMKQFRDAPGADSLRAIEPCKQHPGKMWVLRGKYITPVLTVQNSEVEWHSRPTQSLPRIWIQNASLEIAWSRCVTERNSISGEQIVGYECSGLDGFDINTAEDLDLLKIALRRQPTLLPKIDLAPFDVTQLKMY